MTPISEETSRKMTVCIGCDKPKEVGIVVCWDCFKYFCPKHPFPLKRSHMTFEQWQEEFDTWEDVKP
jgi:hypothetical protein